MIGGGIFRGQLGGGPARDPRAFAIGTAILVSGPAPDVFTSHNKSLAQSKFNVATNLDRPRWAGTARGAPPPRQSPGGIFSQPILQSN